MCVWYRGVGEGDILCVGVVEIYFMQKSEEHVLVCGKERRHESPWDV